MATERVAQSSHFVKLKEIPKEMKKKMNKKPSVKARHTDPYAHLGDLTRGI